MKTTTEQMDASQVLCPNPACQARGKIGEGNIISHGKKRARYRCKTCGKTFSAQAGTMFEGLRKPKALIVIVVTLLAYGCPIQAIVQAFGLDERTVGSPARSSREALPTGPSGRGATRALGSAAGASRCDAGERAHNDRLDGSGDDGLDTLVVGRRRQPDARSQPGRSAAEASTLVLSA